MSRRSLQVLMVVMLIAAVALVLSGCAKPAAGIKDEEAIKAITTTVEGNVKGYKLASPITILERGAKNQAGEFPFKVEYTVTLQDGSSKKETMTYLVSPGGVDSMGVNVFNAVEAK